MGAVLGDIGAGLRDVWTAKMLQGTKMRRELS
jgi:hypothetical protein